jgi:hypothetical protein
LAAKEEEEEEEAGCQGEAGRGRRRRRWRRSTGRRVRRHQRIHCHRRIQHRCFTPCECSLDFFSISVI